MWWWNRLVSHWFDLGVVVLGRTCEHFDCRAVAAHDVRWPGRESSAQCQAHRDRAARIAEALGFELWSTPRYVRELHPPSDQVARFAAVELDR